MNSRVHDSLLKSNLGTVRSGYSFNCTLPAVAPPPSHPACSLPQLRVASSARSTVAIRPAAVADGATGETVDIGAIPSVSAGSSAAVGGEKNGTPSSAAVPPSAALGKTEPASSEQGPAPSDVSAGAVAEVVVSESKKGASLVETNTDNSSGRPGISAETNKVVSAATTAVSESYAETVFKTASSRSGKDTPKVEAKTGAVSDSSMNSKAAGGAGAVETKSGVKNSAGGNETAAKDVVLYKKKKKSNVAARPETTAAEKVRCAPASFGSLPVLLVIKKTITSARAPTI